MDPSQLKHQVKAKLIFPMKACLISSFYANPISLYLFAIVQISEHVFLPSILNRRVCLQINPVIPSKDPEINGINMK